jgi:membrane protein implicated in regulation of membrane protease activity
VNGLDFLAELPAYAPWLLSGLVILILGGVLEEPIMMSLGLAALITAIAALSSMAADLSVQLVLWMVLSICLTVLMQGFTPRESEALRLPSDAVVHDEIPSDGYGYVRYNGALWKACCHLNCGAIAPGQMVYVVGRQANTLIVVPSHPPEPPRSLQPHDTDVRA